MIIKYCLSYFFHVVMATVTQQLLSQDSFMGLGMVLNLSQNNGLKNWTVQSKGKLKNHEREGVWIYTNDDGTVDKKNTGTYKNGNKISD